MIFSVKPVEQKFFGWRIVGAAFTVLFVVYGIQFSFGTFVGDVVDDTGWSENRLQLIFAIYIGLYSALSAISGWLTDRMGPRPVVAVGAVLLTSGYLLWATANNIIVVAIGMAIVAPLGMSCSWVPCNATVVRWFVVRRGSATAIATAGGSLANILVPPIAAVLVSAYGWRVAILAMSLTGGICMLLSSIVLERDPEGVGQKPDGRIEPTGGLTEDLEEGMTPAEAWRSPTYWKIFGMYALTFVAVFVPFVHGVQFAQSLGASLQTASTVISAIGIGGLIGRLVMGPVSDRIGRKNAVMLALFLGWPALTRCGCCIYRQQRLGLPMEGEWWSSPHSSQTSLGALTRVLSSEESSPQRELWPLLAPIQRRYCGTLWATTGGLSCFQA